MAPKRGRSVPDGKLRFEERPGALYGVLAAASLGRNSGIYSFARLTRRTDA